MAKAEARSITRRFFVAALALPAVPALPAPVSLTLHPGYRRLHRRLKHQTPSLRRLGRGLNRRSASTRPRSARSTTASAVTCRIARPRPTASPAPERSARFSGTRTRGGARELRGLLRDEERRAECGGTRRRPCGSRSPTRRASGACGASSVCGTPNAPITRQARPGRPRRDDPCRRWARREGKPEWWTEEASHADPYERFAAQILEIFLHP
jgi:hypothetical protein